MILPTEPPPATPRLKLIAPPVRCEKCRDELTVYARGKAWCVLCDAAELFGDATEGGAE